MLLVVNFLKKIVLDTPEKQEIARRIEILVAEVLVGKKVEAGFIRQDNLKTNGSINASPTDTTHLENQIDTLVFELYGLSEVEIAVVLG